MEFNFRKIQKQIWGTNDHSDILAKMIDSVTEPGTNLSWKDYVTTEFPCYSSGLPSPLPTAEEITAAQGSDDDLAKELPNFSQVVRVRDYAIKMETHPKLLQVFLSLCF